MRHLKDNLELAAQGTPLILAPIHCPVSVAHPQGHWTLLAIQTKKDEATPEVRYYESLEIMNDICFSKAVKLCGLFDIPEHSVIRTNHFRQKEDECTEVVMAYMESEVRNLNGESFGAVKTLHPNQRRLQRVALQRFCDNLEKARMQWYDKECLAVEKKKTLAKWIENKVGKDHLIQMQLLKLKTIAEKTAELMQQHKGLVGFDLPKPEPKPKSKAKPKAEIALPGSQSADVSGSCGVQPEQEEQSAQQPECELEKQSAAEELEDLQNQVAKAEGGNDMTDVSECDPQLIEEMQERLDSGEKEFNSWAKEITKEQRQLILESLLEKSPYLSDIKAYLKYVQLHQITQGCTKCRFSSGCEKCWHDKAQIYAIRRGKVPAWWSRTSKVIAGM